MRRYLWTGLLIAMTAVISLVVAALYTYTRNLDEARKTSRERMIRLANYIVDDVNDDAFSYSFTLGPMHLPADFVAAKSDWLSGLAKAAGLERVALTDSTGHIYIASVSDLPQGENIIPFLRDTTGFESARREGILAFTPIGNATKGSLQSMYFPFDFFGGRSVIVIEEDLTFLAQFEQYRSFVIGIAIMLPLITATLFISMLLLDRKAGVALAALRRHEQLAFLGRTSAELAHELKNPLAIIKTSVDVLRRKFDPGQKDLAFEYLSDEAMRLSRIIGNILSLSRNQALETRPFSLAEIQKTLQDSLQGAFQNCEFKIEFPSEPLVLADADSSRQVFENLARNAAQAMEGKGACRIWAQRIGGSLSVFVADSGPGIPKHLRKHLFDPFVTGSKTGTGLGLAIVRNLCDRMGWSIRLMDEQELRAFDDNPSWKTAFRLTLPLIEAHS